MDQTSKKLTIKDVARVAGVSKGTVDRVVHNRGEVSERSRKRVLEVIEQLGYRPNIYASMLASRRKYMIACLIPSYQPGEFWELVAGGIDRARREEGHYNVEIEVFQYEQFDEASFSETCRRMLDSAPSGVVMAPMYRDSTAYITTELASRSIPYVFIDSRFENMGYLAFFGMSMYQSGYQAADLLMDGCGECETIATFSIERPNRRNNPTSERSRGCMAYMEEHHPRTVVYEEFIRPYDTAYNIKVLDAFFASHPGVRSLITFNSRVHLIAEYLEYRGLKDYRLVGFDMLGRNIDSLRKGFCKYLVTNVTEMQVYYAFNALLKYLTFHKTPAQRDNFSGIDILTRYNADYYFK
ncbi:MAG: LacI family transcriptional regulator [Rikenellaceae bacterium]|jgi:LacI family transcriptional regulator|nr:LacI family transcriptional regulator [Rikenellaceae bacterium]